MNEAVNDERPFFLTVSFHYPHPPYRVPSPWNKMYDYRDVQLPPSYRKDMKKGLEYQYSVMWPWMDLGHMTEMIGKDHSLFHGNGNDVGSSFGRTIPDHKR